MQMSLIFGEISYSLLGFERGIRFSMNELLCSESAVY